MQRKCPDDIIALFDDAETRPEGRRRVVEWLKTQVGDMRPGDIIWIPDAETGELISFEKDSTTAPQ